MRADALERRIGQGVEQSVLRIVTGTATVELSASWNGSNGTSSLRWIHPDRLGSPVLVTDEKGTQVERLAFGPWGQAREEGTGAPASSPGVTQVSFTGHIEELGVVTAGHHEFIDMGGRIYSPLLARFWSPDSIVQEPFFGPSWNRFAYGFDNPLRYTDPTGHAAIDRFITPLATLGDYVSSGASQAVADAMPRPSTCSSCWPWSARRGCGPGLRCEYGFGLERRRSRRPGGHAITLLNHCPGEG